MRKENLNSSAWKQNSLVLLLSGIWRSPRGRVAALLALPVLFILGLFVVLWGMVQWRLYDVLPHRDRFVFHRVVHAKSERIPQLLQVEPYLTQTLALFLEHQRIAAEIDALEQAEPDARIAAMLAGQHAALPFMEYNPDVLFALGDMLANVPDVQSIPADAATSLSQCADRYLPRWQAVMRLMEQPDYSNDIMELPMQRDGDLAAMIASDITFHQQLYFWHVGRSDPRAAADELLRFLKLLRTANDRSILYKKSTSWCYELLPKLARSTRDSAAAMQILRAMEGMPPAQEMRKTPRKEIFEWAIKPEIGLLREYVKAGYRGRASAVNTPLELFWECIKARQAGFSERSGPRSADLPDFDPYNLGLPSNRVLGWLCNGSFGRLTAYARELHYLERKGWDFSHMFPGGNSAVASIEKKQPSIDDEVVRYEIARLNIAAYLYYLDRNEWPRAPANLSPAYLEEEPKAPAYYGPYVWSPERNEFVLRKDPVVYGIL